MSLQSNPLNLHPILNSLYQDLLARFATTQGLLDTVNSTLSSVNANLIAQGTTNSSMQSSIITAQNAITAAQSSITTINNTTLPGLNSKFLRKDQDDSTAYKISVGATPSNLNDAIRKGDVIGGYVAPYRIFRNVSSTDVRATTPTGGVEAITDPYNAGGKFLFDRIVMRVVTPPGLSSVVTVKSNGVQIWQSTIALGALTTVGKLTEILNLQGSYPADLTLPATLTVSASSGAFDFRIYGQIVPA